MRESQPRPSRLGGALLVALFSGVACGALYAAPAYVQNATDYVLYLRTSGNAEYRQVPPSGLLPLRGATLVEGFAYDRGSFQLPTVRMDLALAGEATVATVRQQDLSMARTLGPSDVGDTISGPRLDNRYLDWLPVSPLFARGKGRVPLGSFVDQGSGREEISSGEALLWERSGTDLEWMKTARVGDDLLFAVSAYSAFARSSSLSLFVYGSSEVPVATIDVDASLDSSFVLMWLPRQPEPIVVGNAVAGDFFVEAQLWLDVIVDEISRDSTLGAELQKMLASGADGSSRVVMLEIATASSAAGVWEEFVLARVPFAQVLVP